MFLCFCYSCSCLSFHVLSTTVTYVQALLQIMGSRLCMAGGVQAIYIKTVQGVLIKVEPHTHIPKTLGPFCAMMCEFPFG